MPHMIGASDLPDTLSVFPLPGALLLPRARLPLHIFEPRYLAMLEDALKTRQRLIGLVQPLGGDMDAPNLHAIGCAGRVTSFSETDDGRYMIPIPDIYSPPSSQRQYPKLDQQRFLSSSLSLKIHVILNILPTSAPPTNPLL